VGTPDLKIRPGRPQPLLKENWRMKKKDRWI